MIENWRQLNSCKLVYRCFQFSYWFWFEIEKVDSILLNGFSTIRSDQISKLVPGGQSNWVKTVALVDNMVVCFPRLSKMYYMTYSCVVCYIIDVFLSPFKKKKNRKKMHHCDSVILPLPKIGALGCATGNGIRSTCKISYLCSYG